MSTFLCNPPKKDVWLRPLRRNLEANSKSLKFPGSRTLTTERVHDWRSGMVKSFLRGAYLVNIFLIGHLTGIRVLFQVIDLQ